MWTLDFASDFSGLSGFQIRNLEKKEILSPTRANGCKHYTFQDVLILRLIRILKAEGIHYSRITNAFEYLRHWDPEKPLSSYVLVHDKRDVFSLMDAGPVNATQFGQIYLQGIKNLHAIGSALERTRKAMLSCQKEWLHRSQSNDWESIDVAAILAS